jgi:hypothetical protein
MEEGGQVRASVAALRDGVDIGGAAAQCGGPSLRSRMTAKNRQQQRQVQPQITFGNDKQKVNKKKAKG